MSLASILIPNYFRKYSAQAVLFLGLLLASSEAELNLVEVLIFSADAIAMPVPP